MSDYKMFEALLDLPLAKHRGVLADKGYEGDSVREALLFKGINPVIPPKANRKEMIKCNFNAYRQRNRIERMFNRLKQFGRIATRYDKTAIPSWDFYASRPSSFGCTLLSTGPKDIGIDINGITISPQIFHTYMRSLKNSNSIYMTHANNKEK